MFRLVSGAAETHFVSFSIGRCTAFALSALTAGSDTLILKLDWNLTTTFILLLSSHICDENRKDQMNYIQKGDCYDISENWHLPHTNLSQPVACTRFFSKNFFPFHSSFFNFLSSFFNFLSSLVNGKAKGGAHDKPWTPVDGVWSKHNFFF